MRVLSLSFVALAASAFVPEALALANTIKNNLEIVHGAQPKDYSANYISVFARAEDPDVEFELVDAPAKSIRGKIVSLRRRGIAGCEEEYTVKHGDTCLKITDKFGIHLDEFLFWNPQVNENCKNLKAGKKYCIKHSIPDSPDSCTQRHKVVKGDTCKKVAGQYGISLSQFYEMNEPINEGSCNNLKIGRSYCVSMDSETKEKTSVKLQKVKDQNEDNKSEKKQESKEKEATPEKKQDNKVKESITNLASKTSKEDDKEKKSDSKPSENEKKKESSSSSEDKKEASKTDDGWSKEVSPAPKPEEKKEEEQEKEEKEEPPKKEQRKRMKSSIDMTYYWIAQPQDYNQGGKTVSIKTCSGKIIGKTSQEYADALVMEGTGLLGNKVVNLGACSCSGGYSCFMEINKKEDPYGLTSYGSPLRPFVTAAANDIPRGTKVYVPQLDGWELPGTGKKHNGCLLVDDQGWSFSNNHLDFYVYSMDNYHSLNSEHGVSSVDIYEGGSCKLIDYM